MASHSKRALLANTFGTFGYITCILLWMWVAILYLPVILDNNQVKELLIPAGKQAAPAPAPVALSPVIIVFALAVTVVIMVVTVFVLLRLPVTIARTGKAVTTKAADSITPLVTHGRPLPPKEKRRLTVQLIKLIKLLLVIIPVAAALFSTFVPLALPFGLIALVSAILAALAVFWFSAQYISADMLGVKPEKLV